ncbi:DUF4262 domain-containing protein [Streptomyces griseus]|uniref:DUF4262 domain-containing protein n=1 Tax=Streptomyces griseus TaxID=1911 RepID=UPI0037B65180
MTTGLEHRTPPKTSSHDVLWVFDPAGDEPPFAYTVGLAAHSEHGYELACTGLPAEVSCQVLNNAAAQLRADGLDPADGVTLDEVLEDVYTVRLRPVSDPGKLYGVRAEFDDQPPVWQVLWPDVMHRFPDEPGYQARAAQLLM